MPTLPATMQTLPKSPLWASAGRSGNLGMLVMRSIARRWYIVFRRSFIALRRAYYMEEVKTQKAKLKTKTQERKTVPTSRRRMGSGF